MHRRRFRSSVRFACGAVAAALFLVAITPVSAQLMVTERASLALAADHTAYAPGEAARFAAVLSIEPGWHVNSNQPTYDYLIPTEITVRTPEGWADPTEIVYPMGVMKKFAFADEAISVYEERVVIVVHSIVPDTASEGTVFEVDLRYQACDDKSCLPPVNTSAELEIVIGASGKPLNADIFADKAGAAAAASESGEQSGPALGWMLLLGVFGGLILNAMPCVLPVLSLKLLGLVQSAGHGRKEVVTGALATATGIIVSFWGLAAAAILARSGGAAIGWGVQFQEPLFVAALTIVVVLFCLNLWGLFEIPLPGRLAGAASSGPSHGVAGHFTSGLFATLMATPCSAPFLGTAVGFGLSQTAPTILMIFTAVAVGMALPYLFLAIAPQTISWLPKPGPWMVKLRVVLGFLLAGAAVWLLYVLSAQISQERLAFFEVTLLAMTLFIWASQQAGRRSGARVAAVVAVLAAAGGLMLAVRGAEPSSRGDVIASDLIDWMVFDRAEAERLASSGSLVFVDVTADWCFTCKVNERLVLETPEIADAFEQHGVIAMKADWTNRSAEIAHYLAEHGRYGIPFYLLYRPDTEPHLFGELLTKKEVLNQLLEASQGTRVTSLP